MGRAIFGGLNLEIVDTGGLMPDIVTLNSPLFSSMREQVF